MTSPNESTDNKIDISKNNNLPILLPNPNTYNNNASNLSEGSSDILNINNNSYINNSNIKDSKPNPNQIKNFIFYKKEGLLIPVQKNEKKVFKKTPKKET
eukprot:jgi/Orpsp1_1/1179468/evm.model.c7180000069455.1